jgi:DNA-binding sugar fermentation-stimulating protein
MEILLETKYGYRETFLRNKGFFVEVDTHIQNSITNNANSDNEVVSLLTGKYMYFVRNKTFHGEKVDSSFRLSVNKEDNELKFLNSVLEPYLIDLINTNDIY